MFGGDCTGLTADLREEAERIGPDIAEIWRQLGTLSPEERDFAARFRPLSKLQVLLRRQEARIRELLGERNLLKAELWDAQVKLDPLRSKVHRLESSAEDLRRQLARALMITGKASAPTADVPAKPMPPRRPLYVAEPPADRFAPPPDRDPSADARTVPEPVRESARQVQLLLLALTRRDLIDDDLADIAWSGPLVREAAAWLVCEEPLPAALRSAIESLLPSPALALLRPDADPRRVRAAFDEAAARERVDNLKAEVAVAADEFDDEGAEAAWDRLAALQGEVTAAQGRLKAILTEGAA